MFVGYALFWNVILLQISFVLSFYEETTIVNGTDSMERIKNVAIKSYQNKFDSVQNRRQIGVLGMDAQRWFPEAVDIIPKFTVPSKDKSQPATVLENFPIVDKNVIYMHAVVALQTLLHNIDDLQKRLGSLKSEHDNGAHIRLFKDIEKKLAAEGEEQLKEKALKEKAELALLEEELAVARAKTGAERELLEKELEDERALFKHQETLARSRMAREEEMERVRLEAALKLESDLAKDREDMRRDSAARLLARRVELDKELETQKANLEKEKVRAEVLAKAEQERANEDVHLRQLEAQANVDREKLVKGVETVFAQVSNMASGIFQNPLKLLWLTMLIVGAIGCYFALKEITVVMRETLVRYFGRPTLVRETSVKWDILPSFIMDFFFTVVPESFTNSLNTIENHFTDVILTDKDRNRVVQIALTTRNAKSTNSAYRHLLLHGPPGTGKTLIARRLALCSGMDYAIMSGGDVGPLGEDAVPQLHLLFKWANRSKRGLLIFIDECEAFLSKREGSLRGDVQDSQRHALNALLYQTGTESYTFMLVLATNRPGDLDSAILDRMDVSMHVGLPEIAQRNLLCALYFQRNVIDELDARFAWWKKILGYKLPSAVIDEECYDRTANEHLGRIIDGFSGREISKLMTAIRYAVSLRALQDSMYSSKEMYKTVDIKLSEHNEKRSYGR